MVFDRNVSRWPLHLAAAWFAGALPLVAIAQRTLPPEALNVKVFHDGYVAAGKPFTDLAALEAWAKPIRIRTLWLDSCGKESTGQLLAVVERFHAVYAEGVQIRTFPAGAPECAGARGVDGRGARQARKPAADLAHLATDRHGRSIMP